MKVSLPEAPAMDRQAMKKRMNPKDPTVASVYLAFFSFAASLWGHDWSAFLTSVFAFRMLASVQLAVFVRGSETMEGISAKSIGLYACSHVFRLSSTLWLTGYLPSDTIADNYLCQLMDIVSLVGCGIVLYECFLGRAKETYMRDKDSFRVEFLFGFCVLLAILLHGDLDDKPLFDTFFFLGVYANCFAVLPQIWLMSKDGFSRQYLTWNYVFPVVGSCVAACLFWSFGYLELVPFECPECTNWVGYTTLLAHMVHALLVGTLFLRNAPVRLAVSLESDALNLQLHVPLMPKFAGSPGSQISV